MSLTQQSKKIATVLINPKNTRHTFDNLVRKIVELFCSSREVGFDMQLKSTEELYGSSILRREKASHCQIIQLHVHL